MVLELEAEWLGFGADVVAMMMIKWRCSSGGNDASDKAIRVETREAWNTNAMDAGCVFFFLLARTRMACEVPG